jgi:hypothetical protein
MTKPDRRAAEEAKKRSDEEYEEFWRSGLFRRDPLEIWDQVPVRLKLDLLAHGAEAP